MLQSVIGFIATVSSQNHGFKNFRTINHRYESGIFVCCSSFLYNRIQIEIGIEVVQCVQVQETIWLLSIYTRKIR